MTHRSATYHLHPLVRGAGSTMQGVEAPTQSDGKWGRTLRVALFLAQ